MKDEEGLLIRRGQSTIMQGCAEKESGVSKMYEKVFEDSLLCVELYNMAIDCENRFHETYKTLNNRENLFCKI